MTASTAATWLLAGLAILALGLPGGVGQAAGPAAAPAAAAPAAGGNASAGLLDVTADSGIEWHQELKAYVARGHAVAKRGTMTVYADVLTAYYREVPAAGTPGATAGAGAGAAGGGTSGGAMGGGTEVYRIHADGNVHIVSPERDVYGDNAIYDLDRKLAYLTGRALRLVTAEDTVTARDSLEFYEIENLAVARGEAVAVRRDRRIRADVLVGSFAKDAEGGSKLERIDGTGNVEVTTPTDTARSQRLAYSAATELAVLSGDVRITREDRQVNGDVAEINLATNVSRVLSAGRRVQSLIPVAEGGSSPFGAPAPSGAKPPAGGTPSAAGAGTAKPAAGGARP